MTRKVQLVIPEAPPPSAAAVVTERRVASGGIRLGVLDNSKGNADHLLRMMVEGVKSSVSIASVVSLRKNSVTHPAPAEILDQLTEEADIVVSAMAD